MNFAARTPGQPAASRGRPVARDGRPSHRGACLFFALAAAIAPGLNRPARAQVADPFFPAVNGIVYAQAVSGNTLYIGGNFGSVGGVTTGGFAALDPLSGAPSRTWPRVSGRVQAAVSDGKGGWFIGGFFTNIVGLSRTHLAHIRADGTLDAWNPNVDGQVYALALHGSTLLVGGSFSAVGGQARGNLAAVDAITGSVLPLNPGAAGPVQAIALQGSTAFVGGNFLVFGGAVRNALAAVDVNTGEALAWNPRAGPLSTYPFVSALAVQGNTVYAAGYFTTMGDQPRKSLAAVDATTGAVLPWAPDPNSQPHAFVVKDSVLYMGGAFTAIAGQTRGHGAAFAASTGQLLPWNPQSSQSITCLADGGSRLFGGGRSSNFGDDHRGWVSGFDLTTGAALPWSSTPDGLPLTIGVSPDGIFVGGDFRAVGWVQRENLAAIDCSTGEVLPWNPGTNAGVYALAVQGTTVFAGGTFGLVNGQSRIGLAGIDAVTGSVGPWVANTDASVQALAVSGSTVYVGGHFGMLGGQPRNRLGSIDAATGAVLNWNPAPNGSVLALTAYGSSIYAGGSFNGVGANSRLRLAAWGLTNGELKPWNPSASNTVTSLAAGGGRVYVGGDFSSMGLHFVMRLCPVDTSAGFVQQWQNVGAQDRVRAMTLYGQRLFVAGDFPVIGNVARPYIATIDATTGLVLPWDFNSSGPVYSLSMEGSTLHAGGFLSTFGGMFKRGLARILDPFGFMPLTAELHTPHPGEVWFIGERKAIQWATAGGAYGAQSVDLSISRAGPNGPWELIGAGITNRQEYEWKVSGSVEPATAYFRIDARDFAGATATAYAGPCTILDLTTPTMTTRFAARHMDGGVLVEWALGAPSSVRELALERSEFATGPFVEVARPLDLGSSPASVVDAMAPTDRALWYRLKLTMTDGTIRFEGPIELRASGIPLAFSLSAPSPNPAIEHSMCAYGVPRAGDVRVSVYDVMGREVHVLARGPHQGGRHSVSLSGSRLESGLYFIRLVAPGVQLNRRFVVCE